MQDNLITYPSLPEIFKRVDELQDEAVAQLKELVSIDSLLHKEDEAQNYISEVFKKLGLKVDRFPIKLEDIKDLKGFSPVEWKYEGKENVVGVHEPVASEHCSKPRSECKSLILNGHIDVVPTGNHDLWTSNPFSPYVKDGRLYGRGAGDMKAGIIAYMYAFRALKSLGFVPAAKVLLQSVVEEECTGNGTLACMAKGYTADACIVTEPCPAIALGQVGLVWCRVAVQGKPAHALEMGAGVNAIDGAMHVVAALRKLEDQWNSVQHPAFKHFKRPLNFNLGVINGGEWTSSVPCECTFEVRAAFYPGASLEEVKKELEATVKTSAEEKGLRWKVTWNGFQAEGYLSDPSQPLFKTLSDSYRKTLNKEPILSTIPATTDARFFSLYYNIPATVFGPEASSIHGIDESVSLESLKEVTKTLACFIVEWCGLQPSH